MKKFILSFVLIFPSLTFCSNAIKLPNARRVLVHRLKTIKSALIELKDKHTDLFNELCTTIFSCRKKTKCYFTCNDLVVAEKIIQSITGSSFTLWNDKQVIHPDVRTIILALCKIDGCSFTINEQ